MIGSIFLKVATKNKIMNTLKFIGVFLLVRKTNEIWISSQLFDEVHVTTYFNSEPNFLPFYTILLLGYQTMVSAINIYKFIVVSPPMTYVLQKQLDKIFTTNSEFSNPNPQ